MPLTAADCIDRTSAALMQVLERACSSCAAAMSFASSSATRSARCSKTVSECGLKEQY